jgi:hypothetical protein
VPVLRRQERNGEPVSCGVLASWAHRGRGADAPPFWHRLCGRGGRLNGRLSWLETSVRAISLGRYLDSCVSVLFPQRLVLVLAQTDHVANEGDFDLCEPFAEELRDLRSKAHG